jgi:hypothetical protein
MRPSGVVRPDDLSDEALDASMANFKAERARRNRAANPPGSSGAGAIASTQANPAPRRATQANASTRTSVGGGLAASQASHEALFGGGTADDSANTQG